MGCLDRTEAFEWAEDLRLKMVPHELEYFDACARSVGLVLSEQASACVEHVELARLHACSVVG